MSMLLTGRRINAAQALSYGLINQVVPLDGLGAAVDSWIEDIVACAPLNLKAIERSAYGTARPTVPEAHNAHLPRLTAVLQSRDADEGVLAIRQRRAPEWTGTLTDACTSGPRIDDIELKSAFPQSRPPVEGSSQAAIPYRCPASASDSRSGAASGRPHGIRHRRDLYQREGRGLHRGLSGGLHLPERVQCYMHREGCERTATY